MGSELRRGGSSVDLEFPPYPLTKQIATRIAKGKTEQKPTTSVVNQIVSPKKICLNPNPADLLM